MSDWKTYLKAAKNTAQKQAAAWEKNSERPEKGSERPEKGTRTSDASEPEKPRRSGTDPAERRAESDGRASDDGRASGEERPVHEHDASGEPRGTAKEREPASASTYLRAAGRTLDKSTRDTRKKLRTDADAYAKVSEKHLREANKNFDRSQLGTRLLHALRDALLMGGSIAVIWLIIGFTGVQIPVSVVIVIILVVMIVRFGVALFRRPAGEGDDEGEFEDEPEDAAPGREYDPDEEPERRRRRG